MQKILYIIRGVPGSGKSTKARTLVPSDCIAEADEFMVDQRGNYRFDPKMLPTAHGKCKAKVERLMQEDRPAIAVSNTFMKKWEAEPYFLLAKQYGYTPKILVMKGTYQNEHGVPDEKVALMRNNMEDFTERDFV